MKLRHLPPAAAPLSARDLWHGTVGLLGPRSVRARLERDFAETLGVGHVFLLSSGRASLTVILRALQRLSRRRRVVVPAYTCFSVPAAVVKAGLDVVPCDLDPATFDFDAAQLEAAVATDPLCVVPTHLFGVPADMARVRTLCRPRSVFVVEDAAQALGISNSEGPLGTLGDVGFFSFGRGKNVTCGNGGAIVTSSPEIAEQVTRECRDLEELGALDNIKALVEAAAIAWFVHPAFYWLPAALPFLRLGETIYSTDFALRRLSGAEAGLLKEWRSRLARSGEARSARVAALGAIAGRPTGRPSPHLRLPILCRSRAERDRLYAASERAGLGFSLMYPSAINAIPELRPALNGTRYPGAESLVDRLITIPVHPLVSDRDRRRIERVLDQVQPALT